MSAVKVDVLNLLQNPGTQQALSLVVPVEGMSLGSRRVALEQGIRVEGVLESIGMGILLRGQLLAELNVECSRCLNPFELDVATVVEELFAKPSAKHVLEEEESEETFEIVEGEIDIEPAVRQAVLIEVPFKPLCRDDCAGLCPVCGKNLNDEPHECQKEPIDVRMSKLVELKEVLERDKRRHSG